MGIKVSDIKVKTAQKGGDDEKVEKFTPKLMRLRGTSGEGVRIVKVAQGEKPSISKLDPADVFLYDSGFRVWLCLPSLIQFYYHSIPLPANSLIS